ncbi:MAG: hypothetical protein IPJ41_12820 [Phycisphaerales bacterium]|nr:hypothetical protein [Phycisphaerales bacterium]
MGADNLTDAFENRSVRPVGPLNTHVDSDGETSITGASSDGYIVRLWAPAENRAFTLDNLSELAARV